MSAFTGLWVVCLTAVPMARQAPDPSDVKPGWLGFGVFLALAVAVVLLWLSFRKQLRKVDFEEEPPDTADRPSDRRATPS